MYRWNSKYTKFQILNKSGSWWKNLYIYRVKMIINCSKKRLEWHIYVLTHTFSWEMRELSIRIHSIHQRRFSIADYSGFLYISLIKYDPLSIKILYIWIYHTNIFFLYDTRDFSLTLTSLVRGNYISFFTLHLLVLNVLISHGKIGVIY